MSKVFYWIVYRPRILILVLRTKSDWIYYETGLPQNKVSTKYAEKWEIHETQDQQ